MDDDVVYMLSKACPADQMEVVIAVDMRKKALQGVAKLVTGKDFTDTRISTSEISKYLRKDEGNFAYYLLCVCVTTCMNYLLILNPLRPKKPDMRQAFSDGGMYR